MANPQQLAKQFREVILNGTWIANTNYQNELTGLDWKVATTPLYSLNTIAVLAQHIHYYIKGISDVLQGGSLNIKDAYSFDFKPITSAAQWESFLSLFWSDAEAFAALVEQLPNERLEDVFVDTKYSTYYRNITGMIEHSYYHLGQVVLLKKIALNSN